MPVLHCYVDDDTMKRLKVIAHDMHQDATVLAECAISEAAFKVVPCMNGRPVDKRLHAIWDALP